MINPNEIKTEKIGGLYLKLPKSFNTNNEEALNKAMNLTVELWNTICSISGKHPMDEQETARDIHNIQNRIFSIAHKQGLKIENQR